MGNGEHMSDMLRARATTSCKLGGGDELRRYIIRVVDRRKLERGAGFPAPLPVSLGF